MRDWRRWPCVWRSPPCWALSASFFLVSPQCWPLPPSQLHMSSLQALCSGLPLRPLPENRGRQAGVPHAPVRTPGLSLAEKQVSSGPVLLRPWPLGILQVVHSEHPGFLPSRWELLSRPPWTPEAPAGAGAMHGGLCLLGAAAVGCRITVPVYR